MPRREHQTVLDVVTEIQREQDPTLAYRFACRVGMCGSCAMVVNGRERLTCSTLVKTVGDNLRIEPLRNLPVVRDLAVDLKPFFAALLSWRWRVPLRKTGRGWLNWWSVTRTSRSVERTHQ